jgi:SgrR family transcriptional regulator
LYHLFFQGTVEKREQKVSTSKYYVHLLGKEPAMQYELALYSHFQEQQPTHTSIEELAAIWSCSTRYAKTIIQRLANEKAVSWEAFRGRGKKPILTLNRTKLEAIHQVFDSLWQQEHFHEAYTLLMSHQLLQHPIAEKWLMDRYGVQQLPTNEHIFRQPFYKVAVNFDPLHGLSRHDLHFAEQLHETLFSYHPELKKTEPNLLFHYETEDNQTWRFIVRKDVYFHNNQQLTAYDIKWSLERAASFTEAFFTYKHIEVLHDYELIITLTKTFSLFPRCLASYRTAIVPRLQEHGKIGCGPFLFVQETEEKLQLNVFTRYFKQRPWIDGIEILYTDPKTGFGISISPFHEAIAATELVFNEDGADFISFNMRTGPLADPLYRETIYALIDENKFLVKDGGEIPAYSWEYGRTSPGKKAAAAIPAERFPSLKIGFQQIREGANHEREATILQSLLESYGIESTVELVDFRLPTFDISSRYDLFVGGYALGKDVVLSLIALYTGPPMTILNMAADALRKMVLSRIEKAAQLEVPESILDNIRQIEMDLQHAYCLKLLNHRTHSHFLSDDLHYRNIQFDSHGRIDYKRIWM